ncbi:MAG: hypothetical protein E7029_11980 [Planctomycetaceae bacterium]|nr:hypothetical protein [Planctomycetaceae bacterium]
MKNFQPLNIPRIFSVFFAAVCAVTLFQFSPSGVSSVSAQEAEDEKFDAKPVQLSDKTFLIAPHGDSVVVVSRLWLILKGECPEEVLHNGQPVRWDSNFGGDVHVSILRLDIGMQKLKIGDRELEFVLGRNEKDHAGPSEWMVYRLHNMKPGRNPCMRCHETEKNADGKIEVGALMSAQDACFKCHIPEKIDVQHSNTVVNDDWRTKCSDCHFIHASPYKYLLRQPRGSYLKDPSIPEAPEK